MLKDAIEKLKQTQVSAAEAQKDAEEELDRRREWNKAFNERIKGTPFLFGDGGVPGFDADDPIL